jgi:flagellar protein FlaG
MNELTMKAVENLAVSPKVTTQALANKVATFNAQEGKAEMAKPKTDEKTEAAQVSAKEVQEAVSRINDYVQQSERKLDFRLDEDSGQTVIRVYDKQSDELIRQIPGELVLKLAQNLSDEEPSLLFRAQV